MNNRINIKEEQLQVLSKTIASGGFVESDVITLGSYAPNGYVTIQVETTGPGKLRIQAYCSINGSKFVIPHGATDVITAHEAGDDMYVVKTKMAVNKIQFKFTASDGQVVMSAWILVQ